MEDQWIELKKILKITDDVLKKQNSVGRKQWIGPYIVEMKNERRKFKSLTNELIRKGKRDKKYISMIYMMKLILNKKNLGG